MGERPELALRIRGLAEGGDRERLVPLWRGGEEFEEYVREQEAQMAEISRDIGIIE